MQSAQAVGGHGDDDDAQNDAKPEHSAGRTRRADGSQLTRSVIVTPNSPQFVLHRSDVSRFFVNNTQANSNSWLYMRRFKL